MLEELAAQLEAEIPGFRIRFKDEDRWQRLLGKLLAPLNPGYLSSYITVLGRTIYWPSRRDFERDPARSVGSLLHERVHLWDWKAQPLWFPFSYVFWGPAVWTRRAHWERRGYAVDLVVLGRRGRSRAQLKEWMVKVFTGSAYGWMWTRPDEIEAWVDRVLDQGLSAELDGPLLESTQRWVDRLVPPR